MVAVQKIGWGKYGNFEGPFFPGSIKYELPPNPTEDDKRLRVLTSTEGGSYDAINMYDQCIVSVGLIQWCEAQYFLTSRLLHAVCEAGRTEVVLTALKPALDLCCADFKKNANGQWRFFSRVGGIEVNTVPKQQQLFLGCDGKQGSWNPITIARAKLWASCLSNVWIDEKAQAIQADYTAKRLIGFIGKESKQVLWDNVPNAGWPGMIRAAFLSFAGNNPKKANDQVIRAGGSTVLEKWSKNWCINLLKQLTFGPGVAIYGKRYDDIRPWLEKLWEGVELPKTHADLLKWKPEAEQPKPEVVPVISEPEAAPEPAIEVTVIQDKHERVTIDVSHPPPPVALPTSTDIVMAPTKMGIFAFIIQMLLKFFGKR